MVSLSDKQRCVIVRGKVPKGRWQEWFEYADANHERMGCPATHLSARSPTYRGKRVLQLWRQRKKLAWCLQTEDFESIDLLSLPDKFLQAVFDYHCLTGLDLKSGRVFCFAEKERFRRGMAKQLVQEFGRFCRPQSYEIFEVERAESPLMILCQCKDPKNFKTLRWIEKGFF